MKNTHTYTTQSFLKTICLGLILNCFVQNGYSQLLTNDLAIMTITAGAQLTVQGDVQNQNGGTISNNGTIDLSGHWINNAANNCFGTSAGTVILNGANQFITGSSSTLFNNLTLLGTGTKTLGINTSIGGNAVGGILDIGSRNLILNSKSLSVTNSATNAISFSTGFMTSEQTNNSSKVIWSINSTIGTHTIPFGNAAGVQIPFTFNLTSGNAGNVSVSTYPTSAINFPLPIIPIAVSHVRNNLGLDNSANTVDRFWEVDNTGTPTAALTFSWAPTENATNGNASPRAQRWIAPSQAWTTPLAGQSNPTTQSVTVPNVSYSNFSPWAVALAASPLPVELVSFDAQAVDNKEVLCKWITASEINNDFFTVERSADGHEFEEAGTVDGAGNSTTVLNYLFTDEHPYNGISYYRLKQTDFNGAFTYSKIASVKLTSEENIISNAFPNPFISTTTVQLNEEAVNAKIELIDAAGKNVTGNVQINFSDNRILISKNNLEKGAYYLLVSGDKSQSRSKIKLIVQ